MAAVVVPAHDEGAVIARCLSLLAKAAATGEIEVVVACNGCSDDTVSRARSFPGVTVLDLPEPSKPNALNAADEVAGAFPRFYVDADVELDVESIRALVTTLKTEQKVCGAPTARFLTEGRPYLVRAFYEVWTAQPYLLDEPVGNGVYALTKEGRARFDRFPALVADDLFVRNIFSAAERVCCPTAHFTVHTPWTIRGLFNMRVRVQRGNAQLQRMHPDMDPQNGSRLSHLRRSVHGVRTALNVGVYVGVNITAKVVARWRELRGLTSWERDDSARKAGVPL